MTTTETETPAAEQAEAAAPAKPSGDRDFTKILDKEPTNLHVHYWGWLQEKTGYSTEATDSDAIKIVQMAVSLYQQYQSSDENKQRREDEKKDREAKAEQAKAERAAAKAKKDAESKAAKEAAAAAAATEAEAAGDTAGAKRQPPPRKGAKTTTAAAAKAGSAPF